MGLYALTIADKNTPRYRDSPGKLSFHCRSLPDTLHLQAAIGVFVSSPIKKRKTLKKVASVTQVTITGLAITGAFQSGGLCFVAWIAWSIS
jgi:hypothetical protein